jgi:hypothetical protein
MSVLLKTKDVAAQLGISKSTLPKLRRELNAFQVGDRWRYYQHNITRYIERQQAKVQRDDESV